MSSVSFWYRLKGISREKRMLLSKNIVNELIRCPVTGKPLTLKENSLVSDTNNEKIEYDIVDGYPILINFENSILDKQNFRKADSSVKRRKYHGLLKRLKTVVSPPKKTTANNIKLLTRLLKDCAERPRVLIVGGGTVSQGMEPLYKDSRIEVVSFDIYASPNVHFVADAHDIPLPENSFDAVIIQAVLEHVLDPSTVSSEIFRILKPGGFIYSETPFLQQVHEAAYDFTRFTESGHRYLFRNFELISSGASAGAGTQILWSIDYFFRGLFRSRTAGKVIKTAFFWLQYFDRLIPEAYNIDSASGVFFLGRKNLSPEPVDIISHYKGAH
ncbi:MAG: class I SAM-dependent methyltransferase [Pseudomonadales bacterium]|nr:class I SAM-dependent methyltransferase [Pseudomonadales bacterium]